MKGFCFEEEKEISVLSVLYGLTVNSAPENPKYDGQTLLSIGLLLFPTVSLAKCFSR